MSKRYRLVGCGGELVSRGVGGWDSKKESIDNEIKKESIHESQKESIFPEINPYTDPENEERIDDEIKNMMDLFRIECNDRIGSFEGECVIEAIF